MRVPDAPAPAPARACRRPPLLAYPLLVLLTAGVSAGCAPGRRAIELPAGPGTALPDAAAIWDAAAAPCRAVRSMEFMLTIGGRAAGARLRRTRMRGAVEGGALRLEALAPFGAPVFILVAPAGDRGATLLLPRDQRVIADARPAELLEALAGLDLDPADVQALLTGCLAPEAPAVAARGYGDDWTAIDLEGDATAFVRDEGDGAVVVAGRRHGLTVAYSDHVSGLPRAFRIAVEAAPATSGATDLDASLSQVNINTALNPAVFAVEVPPAFVPITIDQLRGASPLEESEAR